MDGMLPLPLLGVVHRAIFLGLCIEVIVYV